MESLLCQGGFNSYDDYVLNTLVTKQRNDALNEINIESL